MSPAVAGPALFIGGDTDYVALVRPELDPADPGVRRAAEQAGVAPEELAGPGPSVSHTESRFHSPYSFHRFVTRSAVSGSERTISGQPPSRV